MSFKNIFANNTSNNDNQKSIEKRAQVDIPSINKFELIKKSEN